MMGSTSVTSGSMDALLNLIAVLADPAKVQAVLSDLQAAKNAAADSMVKVVAAQNAAVERESAISEREKALALREEVIAKAALELKANTEAEGNSLADRAAGLSAKELANEEMQRDLTRRAVAVAAREDAIGNREEAARKAQEAADAQMVKYNDSFSKLRNAIGA